MVVAQSDGMFNPKNALRVFSFYRLNLEREPFHHFLFCTCSKNLKHCISLNLDVVVVITCDDIGKNEVNMPFLLQPSWDDY